MSEKNNNKIWLKVKKTGILFEIREVEMPLYDTQRYSKATMQEVEEYKKGEYWGEKTSKKKDN